MADPTPAQRLAQLRQRWERDPKSRVFLQLAEEYRRAGRLSEAVRILESGLAVHPGYVAAQVVLGRCLLDTGDAARAAQVLERAVTQDPTQLVANRLLVEAYLSDGNARKARERLDLYQVLNDRDSEIAQLDERILALGGPAASAVARQKAPPRIPLPEAASAEPAAGPHPALVSVPAAPAGPAESALADRDLSPRDLEAAVPAAPRRSEPFGAIRGPGDAHRILSAIAAAGIFPVTLKRVAAPSSAASDVSAPSLSAPSPIRIESTPVWSFEPGASTEQPDSSPFSMEWSEVESVEAIETPLEIASPTSSSAASSLELEPATESRPATATLGGLYLAQGHLADAEESFESALATNPTDSAALAGLAEVRRRRADAEAAFFDEAPAPSAPAAYVGGLTSRKVEVLRNFLARVRRGAQPHVS